MEYELQFSDRNKAFEVLERAVEAFPISIDIWIHYIKLFLKFNSKQKEILHLFERAVRHCGQDFNSSDLWSLYLKWLSSHRHLSEVTLLYDRILRVEIRDLSQHFKNFTNFVDNNDPIDIIGQNDYNRLQNEYFQQNIENNFNQKETIDCINGEISEVCPLSQLYVKQII